MQPGHSVFHRQYGKGLTKSTLSDFGNKIAVQFTDFTKDIRIATLIDLTVRPRIEDVPFLLALGDMFTERNTKDIYIFVGRRRVRTYNFGVDESELANWSYQFVMLGDVRGERYRYECALFHTLVNKFILEKQL